MNKMYLMILLGMTFSQFVFGNDVLQLKKIRLCQYEKLDNFVGRSNGSLFQPSFDNTVTNSTCKAGKICIAQVICQAFYESGQPGSPDHQTTSGPMGFVIACSPASDGSCNRNAIDCIKDQKVGQILDFNSAPVKNDIKIEGSVR